MNTSTSAVSMRSHSKGLVSLSLVGGLVLSLTTVGGVGKSYAASPACGALVAGYHQITSEAQLRAVGAEGEGTSACELGANYVLMVDLDLTGGADWTAITAFAGEFDGNEKTVTGLTVTQPGSDNQGMFATTASGAEIKDLTLVDVDIEGKDRVGGLIGQAVSGTTVSNVHVSGVVDGNLSVGGFVGENSGTISDSSASGNTTAFDEFAGGFVGLHKVGTIQVSYADVITRTTEGDNAGGFVGKTEGGQIQDSWATGNVFTGDDRAGGFVGDHQGGTIIRAFATGDVETGVAATEVGHTGGGFVARNAALIEYSYATGNVVVEDDKAGGFVGDNQSSGDIIDSYASGDARALVKEAGGFAGDNSGDILRSYSTGSAAVTGTGAVGGFLGKSDRGPTNSFWDTDSSGLNDADGDGDDRNAATGKNTLQMTTLSTFSAASWAIVSASAFGGPSGPTNQIWGIGSGVNCGYPFLWWQTTSGHNCGSESSASSESSAGVPGIFLYVAGPVGRTVGHSPVYYGTDRVAAASEYEVRVLSTSTRNPMLVSLASGELPINGSLPSTMVRLPQLEPGTYLVRMTGKHTTGKTLELTAQISVGPNGSFTAIGPNIPIIR